MPSEAVPTIRGGAAQRDIRRQEPKMRARRRFVRNLMMWSIGAAILVLAASILMRIL